MIDTGPFHQPTYKSHQSLLSESESAGQSGPTNLRWPKELKICRQRCPEPLVQWEQRRLLLFERHSLASWPQCCLTNPALLCHLSHCCNRSHYIQVDEIPTQAEGRIRKVSPVRMRGHETQNRTQLQSELGDVQTMQTILKSHQITKLIQVSFCKSSGRGFQIYNLYISTFSVATKMIHADPVRSRLRNNTLQKPCRIQGCSSLEGIR